MGPRSRTVIASRPIDLLASLRLHRFGSKDPTFRLERTGLERALHGPEGPVVLRIEATDPVTFEAQAWGPGRDWALSRVSDVLGLDDGGERFRPGHPVLRKLQSRLHGLRLAQGPSVFETYVVMVIQQRIAWRDAVQSFRYLMRRHAERAPGSELRLFPPPAVWRTLAVSEYQEAGVDARRAGALRRGATSWRRIEEVRKLGPEAAARRLEAIAGVGPWTSQNVLGFACGHADALPLGDYDLPRLVGLVLADEPHADDARMVQLMAPFAGHRWRVVRWLHESGISPPRFGPRRGRGAEPGPWQRRRR